MHFSVCGWWTWYVGCMYNVLIGVLVAWLVLGRKGGGEVEFGLGAGDGGGVGLGVGDEVEMRKERWEVGGGR